MGKTASVSVSAGFNTGPLCKEAVSTMDFVGTLGVNVQDEAHVFKPEFAPFGGFQLRGVVWAHRTSRCTQAVH